MTDPHRHDSKSTPASRPGCAMVAALAVATLLAGWFLAMAAYVLVVEQWGLIAVRREFSYDMALVWAPLFGLIAAIVTAITVARRADGHRLALAILVIALILLFLLFFGMGAII